MKVNAWVFGVLLGLVALLPTVGAGSYVIGQKTAPSGAVDTTGLVRFTALDSDADNGVIRITCTAYSNDADFDVTATPSKKMIGFRVVSDCVTLAPAGQGSPSAPPLPAMP